MNHYEMIEMLNTTEVSPVSTPVPNLKFRKDVYTGMTSTRKFLPSKYFYDKRGDELFQEIMKLPEYYLTNAETEILEKNKERILSFIDPESHFDLIDLGAGDALKTRILLEYFQDHNVEFTYVPVDISKDAIKNLTAKFQKQNPELKVEGLSAEYIPALESLQTYKKKFILFLGASIGNFSFVETVDFLRDIYTTMHPGDLLLTGFDLKKDPETILAAYNDQTGITREFNYNLLHRINRELGANFNISRFEHAPAYNKETGEATSSLVSLIEQEVDIPALNLKVHFRKGEPIHTEISRKYSLPEISELAIITGFELVENLFDERNYFTDSLWRKNI